MKHKINTRFLSRFCAKKKFKLLLTGLAFFGLLISGSHSFAKYIDNNYGSGNAGAAKFGNWSVEYRTTPINIPDEVSSNGVYAFVADFKVAFSEGEVKRAYTLKVKDVDSNVDANDFNSASVRSGSYYYLNSAVNVFYCC